MNRATSLARRYGFDVLIVLAAVVGGLVVALREETSRTPTTPLWFTVPAVALLPLPLLARRRYPFAAPAIVWLLAAALSFVDGRLIPYTLTASVTGMAAAFLLGSLRNETRGRIGLVVVLGGAAMIAYNTPAASAGEYVFTPLLFGIGWLAGFAVHERAAQAEEAEDRALRAEREREAAARLAVAEERARIARELHDIVAHAVSVMVLQVGAVRHNLPAGLEDDKGALRDVERAGRSALAEMRRLLGAMRSDGDDVDLAPQPGLGSLDALLEQIDRTGLAVELHVDGEPFPLPRAIDLSAYRIVQEGLTNAVKHAHASRVDVKVSYAPDAVQLEVRDDGAGAADGSDPGFGLVGIRERVKIYGGEMSAGRSPEGGFVLTTRLPITGDLR
jgi:signal transduction histidine kinase